MATKRNELAKHGLAVLTAMYVSGIPLAAHLNFSGNKPENPLSYLKVFIGALAFVFIQLMYGLAFYVMGLLLFRIIMRFPVLTQKSTVRLGTVIGLFIGVTFVFVFGLLPKHLGFFFPRFDLADIQGFPLTDVIAYGLAGATYGFLYATWVNPPVKTE